MDPVSIFPPHVLDMMFVHLSAKELLSNTLVNSSWDDFIGKSSKCMEKFTLKLRNLVEDYSHISETRRIYINIVSSVFEGTGAFMIKVMSLSNRWKSVEI